MFAPRRAVVMGPSVTMVDGLAAQLGDRSACDCFALATSRLMAALGIWRTWPVAWRTPEDRPRDPCPYRSDEPRESSVGRAADPWGTAQTRVQRVAGHCVPLHATAELSADHGQKRELGGGVTITRGDLTSPGPVQKA